MTQDKGNVGILNKFSTSVQGRFQIPIADEKNHDNHLSGVLPSSSVDLILPYRYVTMDQIHLRNVIINTQIPDNTWWVSIALQ